MAVQNFIVVSEPTGAEGGFPFADSPPLWNTRVKTLLVKADGDGVVGVRIVHDPLAIGQPDIYLGAHGDMNGGNLSYCIDLEEDEFLTGAFVRANEDCVRNLVFETNKGTHGPYPDNEANLNWFHEVDNASEGDYEIAGFIGAADSRIRSLGFVFRRRAQLARPIIPKHPELFMKFPFPKG